MLAYHLNDTLCVEAVVCSCDWLILLSEPKGKETGSSDLDDLETDTGKITDGMAGSTESSDEDFVVLIDERHTSISGDVGGDSLVVFTELNSDAFTDSRVRLLGFDSDLLNDDTSGVRSSSEGFLPFGVLMCFFVA